ncbi:MULTISPECIES: restriction endonuclease subunit S [Bacteroides]|uniref:restriction endonuclease subunit S n=1 Tax=Bacteroides TaxID=816 RepID=UPI000E4DEC25|nr:MULTISPECIES: restriction endonuclease subunit S [Bacteroides]RHL05931.1 restriction endonuclease subunit S [Bacteroides sp. AF39-11AC]
MDTKKLRQKILDLAIHGKLVPQDPNDEPASVLLERIKVEKERLIKEGKIKRSKKSGSSDTLHYPYLLPKGWKWCKLEDIICELKYGTSEKSSSVGKIAVLRMGNITNVGTIDYSNLVYSSNDEDIKQYSLEKDDLLFNRTNSSEWVGKTAIYKEEQPAIYAGYLIRVRPLLISADYLNIVMNSSYYRNWCYNVKTDAVNQSNINAQKLSQLMIPIPPLEEQEKIVVEMAKWISLIGTIKNGKDDLQSIVKQAKNKILDLAIHGKLIPQDPNDEPAIELLKRINPDFTPCDNGHDRKLPQSWCWIKGKNIFSPMKSVKPQYDEFQYIDIESIDNKRQIINEVKTIKTINMPSRASRYTQKGDVVFSIVRPYLRNIAKVINNNCIASTGFYVCSPISEILNSEYCYYLMISDYVIDGLNQFMKGDNSPSISRNHIDEWLFPMPPLAEQQRIVQKIEELFSALNYIQKSLEA